MSHYIFVPLCPFNEDAQKSNFDPTFTLTMPPQVYASGPSESLNLFAALMQGNSTLEADSDSSVDDRCSFSSASTCSSLPSCTSAFKLDDLVDSRASIGLSSTTSEAKFRTVGSAAHSIAVSNSLVAVASDSERETGVTYSPSIEDMAAAVFRQELEDWQTGEYLGDSYEKVFARTRALLDLSQSTQLSGRVPDDATTWEVNPDSSLVAIPSDWFFGQDDGWTAEPAELSDEREVSDPTSASLTATSFATTATTRSKHMLSKVKKLWLGITTKMSIARAALRVKAQRRRATLI